MYTSRMKHVFAVPILSGIGLQVLAAYILSFGVGFAAHWITLLDVEPARGVTLGIIITAAIAGSGILTARLAPTSKMLNAGVLGLISSLYYAFGISSTATYFPLWPSLFLPIGFLACLAGGFIGRGLGAANAAP